MRKWLLAVFVVAWSEIQLPQVVPCPNAQVMTDNSGTQYAPACLSAKDKSFQKEFKTKKEAEKYAEALRVLGIQKVDVTEKK